MLLFVIPHRSLFCVQTLIISQLSFIPYVQYNDYLRHIIIISIIQITHKSKRINK